MIGSLEIEKWGVEFCPPKTPNILRRYIIIALACIKSGEGKASKTQDARRSLLLLRFGYGTVFSPRPAYKTSLLSNLELVFRPGRRISLQMSMYAPRIIIESL